jgi:hypothetical protein
MKACPIGAVVRHDEIQLLIKELLGKETGCWSNTERRRCDALIKALEKVQERNRSDPMAVATLRRGRTSSKSGYEEEAD